MLADVPIRRPKPLAESLKLLYPNHAHLQTPLINGDSRDWRPLRYVEALLEELSLLA